MAADPHRDESKGTSPNGRLWIWLSESNIARPGGELHGVTARLPAAGGGDNR